MTWEISTSGLRRLRFDWMATQTRVALRVGPEVTRALKEKAPVSAVKPDKGRFKDSIGFRQTTEPGAGRFQLWFVSTAPYAKYVIEPTAGGTLIVPVNATALRWQGSTGGTIIRTTVTRGATKGNDFAKRVAVEMAPYIVSAFSGAITITATTV